MKTTEQDETTWVCPNDRELSLRAKLHSGWSFYTNKHVGKKNAVKREEMELIANTLKKSEEVAVREEYRVGRLLDRLENIRNNAKGNGVTTCLLCNEKFGKIASSPMKCNICEKAACAKCGVDTTSSANVPIWLCKLCNEQREFWKKSGGWFFRQMPQHRLPDTRHRGHLESGSFVVSTPEMSRKGNLLSQTSDLMSVLLNAVTECAFSELYSDSDQESSPSSEDFLEEDHRSSSRRHDKLETSVDGDIPMMRPRAKQLIVGENSGSRTPSPSLSDRPRWSRRNSNEMSDEGRPRTDSGNLLGDENVEELFQTYGNDYKLTGPLGVLEFTVNYLKDVKRLDVHIHNARGLRAMDSSGTSDPYVKVHLLPGASKSNKVRTSTLKKTLDPMFNEILCYHGITEEDMKNKTLRLQVLDEDKLGRNDFIGQTTVALKQVLLRNNRKIQKVLEPKSEEKYEVLDNKVADNSPGRIHISLRYDSKEQKLVVGVIRCANLIAMDTNGYSDPYVKCYLLPDPTKKTKRRTRVKKRNLNPEFNEQFSYKIDHSELASRTLEITVWDYDVGKSNDLIGGVHMGINSKGSVLKQWFETLKNQNKESSYWHELVTDLVLNEVE